MTAEDLYLDLMRKCLLNTIYEDKDLYDQPFSSTNRENGTDWPSQAHTMIGNLRMKNILALAKNVIERQVPGDFIETGVWRGGACIFMRAILKAWDIKDRTVWVADSFEGLPEPTREEDAGDIHHTFTELAVSLDEVAENFAKYGLLDEQVRFLKGWFRNTLPDAPIEKLALLRLDGDMYESTIDALNALYHKLSINGFVIVDDYEAVPACKQAVTDFRNQHNILDEIINIDGIGVFWKKSPPLAGQATGGSHVST